MLPAAACPPYCWSVPPQHLPALPPGLDGICRSEVVSSSQSHRSRHQRAPQKNSKGQKISPIGKWYGVGGNQCERRESMPCQHRQCQLFPQYKCVPMETHVGRNGERSDLAAVTITASGLPDPKKTETREKSQSKFSQQNCLCSSKTTKVQELCALHGCVAGNL